MRVYVHNMCVHEIHKNPLSAPMWGWTASNAVVATCMYAEYSRTRVCTDGVQTHKSEDFYGAIAGGRTTDRRLGRQPTWIDVVR